MKLTGIRLELLSVLAVALVFLAGAAMLAEPASSIRAVLYVCAAAAFVLLALRMLRHRVGLFHWR